MHNLYRRFSSLICRNQSTSTKSASGNDAPMASDKTLRKTESSSIHLTVQHFLMVLPRTTDNNKGRICFHNRKLREHITRSLIPNIYNSFCSHRLRYPAKIPQKPSSERLDHRRHGRLVPISNSHQLYAHWSLINHDCSGCIIRHRVAGMSGTFQIIHSNRKSRKTRRNNSFRSTRLPPLDLHSDVAG